MKVINLILISLLTYGFSVCGYAQTNSNNGNSNGSSGHPIFVTGQSANFKLAGQKTELIVCELKAVINVAHTGLEIKGIAILGDGSYTPLVAEVRTGNTASTIKKYLVKGHPRGNFTVSFLEVNGQTVPAATRQKNRRVEMEVVFE